MLNIKIYWQSFTSIFGVEKLDFANVYQLQNNAPNLMMYALPIVLAFTLIEFFASRFSDHKNYEAKETKGSILVGLGNLVVNLLLKTGLIYVAIWIYNLLPWRLEMNWWTLIVCFIVYDFCSYWSHRISHFNRFFWATHVVHHSANYYNLTVAFRQSWMQHIKVIFFIPAVLFGFHPVIFFVASQLSTLYQFWVHTEAIGKLHPFIEKYFGTPSNHRVHHGSQEKYLDKNFGATFMVWDHMFGSFQYEDERPVYGITVPLTSKTNPFVLNFHEYKLMLEDIKQAKGLKEKLFFVFASPEKIYKHKLHRAKKSISGKKKPKLIITSLILILISLNTTLFAQPTSSLPTPKTKDLLFFLQRTPDANTVIYTINYKNDGTIDSKEPIKGSWIRYEENSTCKELTKVEKKIAYGVKCKSLGNDEYEIRLAAYQRVALYMLKSVTDNKYHIYIKDEGKNLLLKRVFVKVNGGTFWFPKVEYIDLFTVNSDNGIEMLKRINLGV